MIEAEKANMTITRMCRLLGVDRRRFHEWRARRLRVRRCGSSGPRS
jgi:putative transposase